MYVLYSRLIYAFSIYFSNPHSSKIIVRSVLGKFYTAQTFSQGPTNNKSNFLNVLSLGQSIGGEM